MAQILLKNPSTGQQVYIDENDPDKQAYLSGGFVLVTPTTSSTTTTTQTNGSSLPTAQDQPTSSPDSIHTLKAYLNGQVVYVKPGVYYPGVSLTPPTTTTQPSATTQPSGSNLVQVAQPGKSPIWIDASLVETYRSQGGYQLVSGGQPQTPSPSQTPTQQTNQPGTQAGASPQATYVVNSLYNKYFGRDGKPDELAFWTTRTPDELNTFLQSEYQTASGHTYDGSPIMQGQTKSQKDLTYDQDTTKALALIDSQVKAGTIPIDIGELFKAVIANYPKDAGFNTQELINTFNTIKTSTIDPHFRELADLASRDIQDTLSYLQKQEQLTRQTESANAAERVRAQQAGLESSGMTFSGEGARTLGEQSAYGAIAGEGTIPQYNRLVAESSANERQKVYNALGLKAEQTLGSNVIAGLTPPSYRVLGGITGTIETQKQKDYGDTLRSLIQTTSLRNSGTSTQNLFS